MSLIDWSDPEEMLGLLAEYVADEQHQATDAGHRRALARVRQQLEDLQARFATLPAAGLVDALQAIHQDLADDLADDPVAAHLEDCITELERINHHQKTRP